VSLGRLDGKFGVNPMAENRIVRARPGGSNAVVTAAIIAKDELIGGWAARSLAREREASTVWWATPGTCTDP
jgi:hypothetical protein